MIEPHIYMQLTFHHINQPSLKQYRIIFSCHGQGLLHTLSKKLPTNIHTELGHVKTERQGLRSNKTP